MSHRCDWKFAFPADLPAHISPPNLYVGSTENFILNWRSSSVGPLVLAALLHRFHVEFRQTRRQLCAKFNKNSPGTRTQLFDIGSTLALLCRSEEKTISANFFRRSSEMYTRTSIRPLQPTFVVVVSRMQKGSQREGKQVGKDEKGEGCRRRVNQTFGTAHSTCAVGHV